MPVDYAEALRDLDAQIVSLESDLEMLRATRPGFVLLRNRQNPSLASSPTVVPRGPYKGLGNQAAVRLLMADGQLRTRDEIYEQLRDGGFTSDAANPAGSIGATLSQMKDELEKIEDRWRKKTGQDRLADAVQRAPMSDGPVFTSPAPANSFASVLYDHPSSNVFAKP